MLEHLEVRGLGIIDRVELDFQPGFVVLTGETGAGKSLLVESLKLIAGQRAHADLVRSGDKLLRVEAGFALAAGDPLASLLDELGIDHSDGLVIRREISTSGRGRCWVNDVSVTAGALQQMAPHLLAIHGQHEHYGVADPCHQRVLVDEFGGHHRLLEACGRSFEIWRQAADRVKALDAARARRRDRLDTIAFQLAEIDAVDPREGEDEELLQRRNLLRHAVRLMELGSSLVEGLSEGERSAVDRLARAERDLEEMVACGLDLAEAGERLAESRVLVEEVVRVVQALAGPVDEDPAELENVESRLHRLDQLTLKYGSSLAEVINHREGLAAERHELARVEEDLEAARQEEAEALASYATAAEALDAARASAGEAMVAAVQLVLERLAMEGTRLKFSWSAAEQSNSPLLRNGRPVAFAADGVQECELLFAANPGEELRPMARVASGGELSRLHLGIRTVLRGRLGGPGRTLLFDEVDSGLGGATAAALAVLLEDLASHDQVLVITHLPQVAARAAGHFRICKISDEGRSVTRVDGLDSEQRQEEIARMLAGEQITDQALAHARDLLDSP